MRKTILLSIALFGLASFPSWAGPSCSLPNELGRIDKFQGKKLYSIRYKGDLYTYWDVFYKNKGDGQTYKFETVLRQDAKGRCFLAHTDPSGEAGTMTKGVPRSVAKAFALKVMQDAVKAEGRESVQANINKMGSNDVLSQELLDALIALGFKVPSSIRLDRYWNGRLTQETYK
jgi:hypothetical protein